MRVHGSSQLVFILLTLVASLGAAVLSFRLRQPTLIGFIVGGLLIGPHVFGLVPVANVELLSEIGVGLLMFTIGLELSIQKLIRVKWIAVLGGALMTGIIIATTGLVGQFLDWPFILSFTVGSVIALSSTAVVLRLLADRGEIGSTHGNINTGLLLFQDILAVPLLTMIPIFAKSSSVSAGLFFTLIGQFTVYVIGLYAAAKFVIPKFLQIVAKTHSKELFSISILCVCIAIATIANNLGLSLALGAFLAGLIVSESEFGNQATTEILLLKEAFGAIFFASIGMLLDPKIFISEWGNIFISLFCILAFKLFVFLGIMLLFRYPVKTSLYVAFGLAQVGEFSILLLVTAYKSNILPENIYLILITDAILSIIATPYLLKAVPFLVNKFQFVDSLKWIDRDKGSGSPRLSEDIETKEGESIANEGVYKGHVVLCGYGPTGAIVLKKLKATGTPTVVIDLNYKVVQKLKSESIPAIYGDCSSIKILEAAGINEATLIVITIPDPIAMRAIVKKVRQSQPDLGILLRVKYDSERKRLLGMGASDVVWEEYEAGQELARRIFERLRLSPEKDVESTKELFRP